MAQVKTPNSKKKYEKQLAIAMTKMVDGISTYWYNNTIGKLNKGDESKFADAKIGNFATVFDRLDRKAVKNLNKRYSDKRIKALVNQILSRVNLDNRNSMYGKLEPVFGIDQKKLAVEEALKSTSNAFMIETEKWVKKLKDETLEQFSTNVLRAMSLGEGVDSITDMFKDIVDKRRDHAKFVARTQVATYNSLMTKVRAQNLGIEKAIWITGSDGRVRPSHRDRHGKEFDLAKGLHSSVDGKDLLPGTDYQCRCTYRLIIPEDIT